MIIARNSSIGAKKIGVGLIAAILAFFAWIYAPIVNASQDTTPPIVTIESPIARFSSAVAQVRISASDDSSLNHYWCQIKKDGRVLFDKVIGTPGVANHLIQTLAADGTYTVTLAARDKAGNRSRDVTRIVTIDSVAPAVDASGVTSISHHSILVAGSVTEPNLESVSLKLNGTDVDSSAISLTGNDFTAELQGLSIGNHTVEIIATDKAGNKSAVKAHSFTVTDNIAPAITITSATTFVEGEDAVVTGTAIDNHSAVDEVSVQVDGAEQGTATVANGEFSYSFGQLAPGVYGVIAKGTDAAGNEGVSDPVTIRVTAKQVAPPVTPPSAVETETPEPAMPEPTPAEQPARATWPYTAAAVVPYEMSDISDEEEVSPLASAVSDDGIDGGSTAVGQEVRGLADDKAASATLSPLGIAWYYWVITVLVLAVITLWSLLAAKGRRDDRRQ